MTIDATFWVAISFFIFLGILIYLKVPQKINSSLIDQINKIKKELDEAERLKVESKNLLSDCENKKQKFNIEIEEELKSVENEIKDLKKTSLSNISNIAVQTSSEVIKQIIDTEVNKSNVSAIVEDIIKRKVEKHI